MLYFFNHVSRSKTVIFFFLYYDTVIQKSSWHQRVGNNNKRDMKTSESSKLCGGCCIVPAAAAAAYGCDWLINDSALLAPVFVLRTLRTHRVHFYRQQTSSTRSGLVLKSCTRSENKSCCRTRTRTRTSARDTATE
jgi:hypothetical protein